MGLLHPVCLSQRHMQSSLEICLFKKHTCCSEGVSLRDIYVSLRDIYVSHMSSSETYAELTFATCICVPMKICWRNIYKTDFCLVIETHAELSRDMSL